MNKKELGDKIVVYSDFFDNPMIFLEEANNIFKNFPNLNLKNVFKFM